MSRKATDWAWSVDIKPATLKLILLSMADRADEVHQCFPSISRLVKDTGLNQKTVQKGLLEMIEMGVISDTGQRKGPTGRVRVFQLDIAYKSNDPIIGNVTDIGALNDPNLGVLNDPDIGVKNQSLESVNESPLPPEGDGESESSTDKRATAKQVSDAYNEILGGKLPKCVALNEKRKRAIKRFLDSLKSPTEKSVNAYLRRFLKVARPFHFGENDRGWRADFDYVIKSDTVIKVREESL